MDLASSLWIAFMGLVTAATAVWIIGFVDCAYRKFPTASEKLAWTLVVVCGHWFGVLIYWFIGRPRGTLRA